MSLRQLMEDLNFTTPREVLKYAEENAESHAKYVGWICSFNGEICERVFSFRKCKNKSLEITEVIRETPDFTIFRNMHFNAMAGWHTVFEPRTVSSKYYGYYFEDWQFNRWMIEPKRPGITNIILNFDDIFDFPQYKYCGYSGGSYLMDYIRKYKEHPEVEYFGKLGITPHASLINKVKKDKAFAKFISKNANSIYLYGPQATIYAYDNNMTIEKARNYLNGRNKALRETAHLTGIKENKIDRIKAFDYCKENHIGLYTYNDYILAAAELGYDMKDTKNLWPKDFMRMHDLRIQEREAKRAKEDKKAKKALVKKFAQVAAELQKYSYLGDKYEIIIPKQMGELKTEGSRLHHCVGRMGYDKKMADGKCIIAFVRLRSDAETPFVTVEYLTESKRVSQCYADHDSRPEQEVIDFVDSWAHWMKKEAA